MVKRKFTVGRALTYVLYTVVVLYIFFPFYWIIATSLREKSEIYQLPPELLVNNPTLENYIFALQESNVLGSAINSLIVTFGAVFISVICCIGASYALARMDFRGKKAFYAVLGSTQMFPVVVIIVPLYMMMRNMDLYNSLWSLVLSYAAIYIPAGTVLMLNTFRDMPKEMEEAAAIDGCNRWQTLLRIILPTATPGIVATAIYTFISMWQEYLIASSMLGDKSKYTLTVALAQFKGEFDTNWGALMATSVIIAVPAIVAFLSIERYFIDNLAGSVKE